MRSYFGDTTLAWQETLFDQFRSDVRSGNLPQVSWIVGPAGYTEHPDYPIDYGAWYISQILDILVSNPDVFSKTIFLINYDEADGSFDHIVPPTPPPTSAYGASTVSIENEVITDATPTGPAGLNTRVPFLAISPWSKGGYVVSQVFDHTSVIQFLEKRFGVYEQNLSPWRRAVAGDLTSVFNFATPNDAPVTLPPTISYLPPAAELAGGSATIFKPTPGDVIFGVPEQEQGVRPARALPYTMDVYAAVNASNRTAMLTFLNTGTAAVVFQVRSGDPADMVRTYTVGPGLTLADTWNVVSSYGLFVYGPNGFVRYFNGMFGPGAAALAITASYGTEGGSSIALAITNVAAVTANVSVLDAYTGNATTSILRPQQAFTFQVSLTVFSGWYDLIVTAAGDPTFKYEAAGHVETGLDSTSDPAMGGLVTLKLR